MHKLCAYSRYRVRACVYVWSTDLFQVTNLALRSKRLPNTDVGHSPDYSRVPNKRIAYRPNKSNNSRVLDIVTRK